MNLDGCITCPVNDAVNDALSQTHKLRIHIYIKVSFMKLLSPTINGQSTV